MPKVTNTRRHKAAELYERAQKGPSIFPCLGGEHGHDLIDKEQFEQAYRRWSESWVLPLLRELVPELKEKKQ